MQADRLIRSYSVVVERRGIHRGDEICTTFRILSKLTDPTGEGVALACTSWGTNLESYDSH
jgi:hypothetical protein